MNMPIKVKALVLALGLTHGIAHAEFVTGMNKYQIEQEMLNQLMAGEGIDRIARDALKIGVSPGQVTSSLISSGEPPIAVVKAVIGVAPNAAPEVTAAAIAAAPKMGAALTAVAIAISPTQSKAITTAAITVPGVNPGDVLSATAAGNR